MADNSNLIAESTAIVEERALLGAEHFRTIDPVLAKNALSTCKSDEPASQRVLLRVYRQRWVVLAIISLLNNINTMSWIAFSPVANHVDAFYGPGATNFFSAIYMACTIPVGFFAMWSGRNFGLRYAILIAAWTNGVGAVIRFFSSFIPLDFFIPRFYIALVGQGIAALAYPFIMFLPTKVAAAWFPDNQRGLATTIGVMSNPLGVLVASLASPLIVSNCTDILLLNIWTAFPSIVLTIVASFVIRRSEPPVPPTVSAGQPSYDFIKGLRVCFTSRQYLLLLLVLGGGIGMFNCLYTIMQQLLCPSGYSNVFSGSMSALLISGGMVGATVAGIVVDRTKLYEETLKISMAVAVAFGITFLQLALHRDLGILIGFVCVLFGVFGLAAYPVGLQLSAECTFPVSETTSTGLIVLSGQVQSIIYLAAMKLLARPLDGPYRQYEVCTKPIGDGARILSEEEAFCASNFAPTLGRNGTDDDLPIASSTVIAEDMTISVIVMSVISTLLVLILVVFFKPRYRRMEVETGGVQLLSGGLGANEDIQKDGDGGYIYDANDKNNNSIDINNNNQLVKDGHQQQTKSLPVNPVVVLSPDGIVVGDVTGSSACSAGDSTQSTTHTQNQ